MKKQILELQNYFLNRITACEFDKIELEITNNWTRFRAVIDECHFNFSIDIEDKLYCAHDSFMRLNIPTDRLSNLINFIESQKENQRLDKIEKLKLELAELEELEELNILKYNEKHL